MKIRFKITGWLVLTVAFAGLSARYIIGADYITGALFLLAAVGTSMNMIITQKKEKIKSYREYIHMN